MKIFQLIDRSLPREVRDEALYMAVAFRGHGHNVEVFHCLGEEDVTPFTDANLPLHRCRIGGALDFLSPVTISRNITDGDAVIIQIFSPTACLCASRARELAPGGARVAIVYNGDRLLPDFTTPSRARLAATIDAYTFPFDDTRRRFIKENPKVDPRHVTVNTPSFTHPSIPSPATSDADASPTLIFFGSITPSKGLDRFTDALEHLTDTNIRAIVVGTGQGRDVMPLLRRVRASKVSSMIEWAGDPPKPYALLSRANAAVFPSVAPCDDYRPMLMAMSLGLPVIASAHSSAPLLFRSDDQYMAIDTESADRFADAIRRITADKTLQATLSRASSERYRQLCDEGDSATRFESLCMSLLTFRNA